ncbi:dienelactone hydrolase family protein [Celeribacter indicus]|uniref:Dienelactone hydrolase family protein n=1 Tax=Celeribacter indicus TaxID=1208324 RepID=A0A0B5E6N7_9RHOB|nr:dienelactone hydrolase family protein [Celeribacter indicus]AJE47987.1 dienelactone hydrolase family protein [Celeribacter indicus]SDW28760.1 Dienelactone hydrolase [Celeribacter indicus]
MNLQSKDIAYDGPGGPFIGKLHWDADLEGPRPGVIVSPAFRGRSAFEDQRAEDLAALGYVGFVMDYYGGGRTTESAEEAHAAKDRLDADRPALAARMEAALGALKSEPLVDPARTAAMGFCFGGKSVLDLARQGAELCGIVSFHGILDRAPTAPDVPIRAAVLVCHGWDDPLAPPHSVTELGEELTARATDWQIHAYGHTGHGFTNPAAKAGAQPGFGYAPAAAARSWRTTVDFLGGLFD